MKKNFKRFLAALLTAVMVLNVGPASVIVNALVEGVKAQAETTPVDAAIFCSDVHKSTSDLSNVLKGIGSSVNASAIGFVGDTCLTVSTTTSTVQSALGDENISVVFSYAASHDTENGADIANSWDYSGEAFKNDYYYIYTIRETDMQTESAASTAVAAFETWADTVDTQKPVFIISHRPLHERRGDNAGAAAWYESISEAADKMDIVFFWGHNHTGEDDVDIAAYYVEKDGTETITIEGGSKVTPNFTYMNAGYINANNQDPARIGVATTVQLYADEMVFQDYNSSGAYTGTYAHNVTVDYEFANLGAATPETLEVTGTTEYIVGATFVEPTVKVTYSDDSEKTVTDYEVEGSYDMNTVGTYTLTYIYTETVDGKAYEAKAEFTFNVISNEKTVSCNATYVDNDGATQTNGDSVSATGNGLTGITASWNDTVDLSDFNTEYTVVYDVALDGYTAGEEVAITMNLSYVYAEGLAVYYVNEDGSKELIAATVTTTEDGSTVTFTTDKVGTFIVGVLAEEEIPEGATLESLTFSGPSKTVYFLETELINGNVYLDIDGLVVIANYIYEGKTYPKTLEWDRFDETVDGYALSMDDLTTYGEKTVTISYGDQTATFTVWVCAKEEVNEENNVTITFDTPSVVSVAVEVVEVEADLSAVMKEGYVAYDITPAYANGYTELQGKAVVTLPVPEGAENPVVYYVSDDGATVTDMNATVSDDSTTVSFETDHFSTYVVGNSSALTGTEKDVTVPGQTGVTTYDVEEVTVYKLVTSPVSGKQYLIVNSNTGTGYGLDGDTSGYTVNTFTGESGYYSTWDGTTNTGTAFAVGTDVYLSTTGAYLWTVSDGLTFSNGDTVLGTSGYIASGHSINFATSRIWSYSNGELTTTVEGMFSDYTYNLIGGSTWSIGQSSDATVYFYEPVTVYKVTASTTDVPETTYQMDVTYNGTATQEITAAFIKDGDTQQLGATFTANGSACDAPAGGSYTVTSSNTNVATVDNNGLVTFTGTEGETLIQAIYTWTENGNTYSVSNYVTIVVTGAIYTLVIDNGDSHIEKGVTSSSTEQLTATVTVQTSETETSTVENPTITWEILAEESDANIATIDASTGLLSFTGNEGTIHVQASYTVNGKEYVDIIEVTAKKSTAVTPDESTTDFPRWPNEGAVRFDKTATAVGNFSETGIAQIELSMAGIPVKTGGAVDVVLVVDLSSSMNNNSRLSYAKTASQAFVTALSANTENRLAIVTFNTNGDSGSSGNGRPSNDDTSVTTDGNTVFAMQYLTATNVTSANTAINKYSTSTGTNYIAGLYTAQSILSNNKIEGREQYVVFLSDGAPTRYLTVDSEGDTSKFENLSDGGTSTEEWITDGARNSSYEYEYYTTQMKAAGITVYTVGLGLNTYSTPEAAEEANSTYYYQPIYLLNDMSGPAKETSNDTGSATSKLNKYFYNVADSNSASALSTVFSNIAEEINAAATNVNVEDVITDEFDMIFELPNANIEGLDGQEFYIEVVDYPLDETTHERTGASTIIQRIYLTTGTNGVYISKIIEGTTTTEYSEGVMPELVFTAKAKDTDEAYFTWTDSDNDGVVDAGEYAYNPDGDGTHHLASGAYVILNDDGSLKSLHTMNFTYIVASKQLNWTVTSMSETSETALRYFVYLENSGGVIASEQIEAGTYPTNEYAHLTYTNINGVECEQTFPVPQMTWNGAQVSYVFYLVNENGVPVNRAGREITFAEAIFVTDIYTYAIIWNDLEQAAGLEASYLAENLLPSAYSLYDEKAFYKIHVYEDEVGVNLNNHFIIDGTSGDKTTYVYNNKTDVTKYNEHGTYAATGTYLCKSYSVTATVENGVITAATYTAVNGETQVGWDDLKSNTGATNINGYAYYIDENGDVYTIVQKTDATAISGFDFANTTVAFAVTWEKKLVEDTVVVDFGLPVDIDVVSNDFVYNYITGIGKTDPNYGINIGYKTDEATLTDQELTVNGHSVKVQDQNHIRFTPGSMVFSEPAVFYYETAVEVYENSQVVPSYMYSKVTVIPATTVYYEDEYVTLTTSTKNEDGTYTTTQGWDTNSVKATATQDQDRPGESQISASLDADNNYGYDSAYENCSQYSMGSAAMVNVYAGKYATAEFTFAGTGFDVISLTDKSTGTIFIDVYQGDTKVVSESVNTYYGYARQYWQVVYTYDAENETWSAKETKVDALGTSSAAPETPEDGDTYTVYETRWVTVDSNDPNALYQVPVIKIGDGKTTDKLTYGTYRVVITASYMSFLDSNKSDTGYNFYLDAIRIYNPTGNQNDTANEAYEADGEGYPDYFELRDQVISMSTFDALESDAVSGIVFIDGANTGGAGNTAAVADYTSYGPNNELYLDLGQAVAFKFEAPAKSGYEVAGVQIAVKTVGGTGYVKIYDASAANASNVTAMAISTATDMYYDITALNGKTMVILNSGTTSDERDDAIVSITNIKVTYKKVVQENTVEPQESSITPFAITRSSAAVAVMSLSVSEDIVESETTESETTESEETEVIEPEETEPEVTEPEETEPEETEPEVTEPEETETIESDESETQNEMDVVNSIIGKIIGFISGLLNKWFH